MFISCIVNLKLMYLNISSKSFMFPLYKFEIFVNFKFNQHCIFLILKMIFVYNKKEDNKVKCIINNF